MRLGICFIVFAVACNGAASASPGPATSTSAVATNVVKSRAIAKGSLPTIEGPDAAKVNPHFTLDELTGEHESEVAQEATVTQIAYRVVHQDARVVTVSIDVSTMGAYPSVHGNTASFVFASGARVNAGMLDHKSALVMLLDARVHAAWKAKKAELGKGPTADTSCGPDVVANFMSGDGPSFDEKMLDSIYVDEQGLAFRFDYDFPHVVKACSPSVRLALPWSEAAKYLASSAPALHP